MDVPILQDMEERKYKQRFMAASRPAASGQDLKERYEEKKKEELVVQKQSVIKLSQVYSAFAGAFMAALALVGAVSLVRPELREILIEIILEAVREIRGV